MVDPRYAAAAQIVGIVALAYVVLGIGYYVQLGMFLSHRTGLIAGVSAIAALVNLGANYLLISHFGMIGAALATLIGFLTLAIGSYMCSERVMALGLPLGRVLQGLCVAIALYFFGQALASEKLAWALAFKGGLLAVFAVVLRLWFLSRQEVATIESLARTAAIGARRFLRVGSAVA
jgi:O-antigen/teichoic acid export membrane protein